MRSFHPSRISSTQRPIDLRGNVTWMSPFQGKQRRCFTYMRDVQTSRELGKWTKLVLPTHEHLESRALTRPVRNRPPGTHICPGRFRGQSDHLRMRRKRGLLESSLVSLVLWRWLCHQPRSWGVSRRQDGRQDRPWLARPQASTPSDLPVASAGSMVCGAVCRAEFYCPST